jgi:hypothetical protein
MKTDGELIRGAQIRAGAAVWGAIMLALGLCRGACFAADSAPADTVTAAPLYEAVSDSAAGSATPSTSGDAAESGAVAPAGSASPLTGAASTTTTAPAVSAAPPSAPASPSEDASTPSSMTGTVVVPDSMLAPTYVKRGAGFPQTTTEIPQANHDSPTMQGSLGGNEIVNYEKDQSEPLLEPQLHSLQEFISEGDNTSPLGIELREERRKLRSGSEADGLLIVGVMNNSPAAKAGLRACQRTAHDVLEGVAVAAALVFPPAMLAVPIVDQVHVAESYDLIIGVDGSRVTNFLDFEDRMRDVQPGEIVYLSIVRNGDRVQVPVQLPSTIQPPVF